MKSPIKQRRYRPSDVIAAYRSTIFMGFLVVVSWEVFTRFFNPRGDNFFPSLGFIVTQTWDSMDLIVSGLQTTLAAVILAYVLAMTGGVVLGILYGEIFLLRQLSMPVLIFMYTLPSAILAPLFIIWFGSGIVGVAIFGAWVAIFPIFINTMTGLNQMSDEFRNLGEIYGASSLQMLVYIKFWVALPHIAASGKITVQLSIIGVIIVEFLASGGGLGHLIVLATQRAQLGFVFGVLFILILFAISFYLVVTRLIETVTPDI